MSTNAPPPAPALMFPPIATELVPFARVLEPTAVPTRPAIAAGPMAVAFAAVAWLLTPKAALLVPLAELLTPIVTALLAVTLLPWPTAMPLWGYAISDGNGIDVIHGTAIPEHGGPRGAGGAGDGVG